MIIKEIVPFTNSIYVVENVEVDLNKFVSSIFEDKNKGEFSYPRNNGAQTVDYKEILPNYKELFDKVFPLAEKIMQSWGFTQKPVLKKYWTNLDYNMGYGNSHSHIGSVLSGVFYSKLPNGCGKIVFERPDAQEYYYKIESMNEYSYKCFEIQPVENCVLMFPSYMKHRIEQHQIKDNDVRISTSFDFNYE